MARGCVRCLRVCLLLSSVLFLIIGDAILGAGIYFALYDGQQAIVELRQTLPREFLAFQVTLIGLGGFIVLVAFCACVGVVLRNKCVLSLHAMLTALLCIGCAVFAIALGAVPALSGAAQSEVESMLRRSYGNTSLVTFAVDHVQASLHCCGWQLGVDGEVATSTATPGSDKCGWFASTPWHQPSCPKSCCRDAAPACQAATAYTMNCFSAVQKYLVIVPSVIFAGMAVSFIHMLCALALLFKLPKERVMAI